MRTGEKFSSFFARLCIISLTAVLIRYPEYRQLRFLLPMTLAGLVVNIIFMFIVLRDIVLRIFKRSEMKIIWVIVILVCWPAVLVYLPMIGFKDRNQPV